MVLAAAQAHPDSQPDTRGSSNNKAVFCAEHGAGREHRDWWGKLVD